MLSQRASGMANRTVLVRVANVETYCTVCGSNPKSPSGRVTLTAAKQGTGGTPFHDVGLLLLDGFAARTLVRSAVRKSKVHEDRETFPPW